MEGLTVIRPVWPYKTPEHFARFIRDHQITSIRAAAPGVFDFEGIELRTSLLRRHHVVLQPDEMDALAKTGWTLLPAALDILSKMDEFDRISVLPRKPVWVIAFERPDGTLVAWYVRAIKGYWSTDIAEATQFNTFERAQEKIRFHGWNANMFKPVEYTPPLSEPKFKRGDRVRKIKGASWQGVVVGEYSTKLTPEGYAVESERERGSVQIYPAAALEMVK